jgi:4-hydroxythreonine-4-phosphate dehydrogenase
MLVVTLGEPYSVNVELLAPLVQGPLGRTLAGDRVALVGSAWQWRDQLQRLGVTPPPTEAVASLAAVRPGALAFLDVGDAGVERPAESLSPAERGRVAVRALEALRTLGDEPCVAVVTGPIDKHACHAAGYGFPGQTEFFEELWRGDAVMTLAGPRLRVGLVTNHLRLADVPRAVTRALVERKLGLFATTLASSFGVAAPRIAVVGLNPHAGDQGLFGDEERVAIAPAIEAVRRQPPVAGLTIDGPVPADTAFHRAYHGRYDGVLAMYHDQGLGPLKTVHFDDGVNLSGGLRHLRVSPDHGPAADLFLAGKASGASWRAAMELAVAHLRRGAGGEESGGARA